ncbi:sugar ABC transporter permease [Bacillus haynesii]|uniref:carbohydrate ABC transporter permease n=1 Tax=Bacillus TaxID=1386 RepID=UPI0012B7BF17|nr:sugar ABC transporter permease [Bacillus haynesii]TWK26178.1 L-arabinose transport system permease protein AraP [Bacillus licheniformis]MBU8684631.1 sugar ABC transporter permease [Bacillus haynesii]MCY7801255.1 sugar ABC transporter permease [Bacillus haynesii]MCY7835295.1 sugar ABC transporter permease [Bacillus haynesii]MCY7843422.1 sugar ABC transporter permease [Bacillus haynesii]
MKTVKTDTVRSFPPMSRKRKIRRLLYSAKAAPYIFTAPFVLSFCIFFLYPLISVVIMSFQSILPGEVRFIGTENYKALNNPTFYTALFNTVKYTFWTLLILIPVPLILAVFLDSKLVKFKNVFKSALFIPALTSTIVAGIIFRLIFGEMDTSLANSILAKLGASPYNWLNNEHTGMFLMVMLASWRWMGINVLYFLAGLQNVPKELYEAAEIDGAGTFKKFYHITLPFLKPVSVYVLTISIIGGFRMFEESYVLWQNNSPGNIGLTMVGYIYQQGLAYNNMGYGSALGIVLLIIIFICSLISLKLSGSFKKEGY